MAVGQTPLAFAVDQPLGRVFLVTQGPLDDQGLPTGVAHLVMLDATTGAVLRRIPLGRLDYTVGENYPDDPPAPQIIAVDTRLQRVFVLDAGTLVISFSIPMVTGRGRVYSFDARTGRWLHTTTVGPTPVALALDERSQRVFVTNGNFSPQPDTRGSVSMLDAASGRVLRTVGGLLISGTEITIDEDTNRVFIGPGRDYILEATTGVLVPTAHPWYAGCSLAVAARQGRIIIGNGGRYTTSISELDATSGRVLRDIRSAAAPPVR